MNPRYGFARITVCSPEVEVANPQRNLEFIRTMILENTTSDVIVFPELCITGYTCGDLFKQQSLLDASNKCLKHLTNYVKEGQLIWVGAPIAIGSELFNCAVAINEGKIIGVVPKQNLAEGGEYYENRHFSAANGDEPEWVYIGDQRVPFGINLLFSNDNNTIGQEPLIVGAEICQDVWMPIAPSSFAALAGAHLVVNLSASPEQIEKYDYRSDLIRVHSGKHYLAYAYASSGPSENTSDLVFSGDCMIAENWRILARSSHIGDGTLNFGPRSVTADIDYQMLSQERRSDRSFGESKRRYDVKYNYIQWQSRNYHVGLNRYVNGMPFVPREPDRRKKVCASVFDIQCAGFYRRWKSLKFPQVSIGVSGGSDSTHMLNVLERTCKSVNQPLTKIVARSMPGFGTSQKTKRIGETLCREMGIPFETIDIRYATLVLLNNMGHHPFGINLSEIFESDDPIQSFMDRLNILPVENRKDVVFENIQARVRTSILMGLGFMIGTGDLSESGVGWTTFGGDHLSNYNPNAGVPKTLIRWMIEYVAKEQHEDGLIRQTLLECANLPFSPELLPLGQNEEIIQSTEESIGSYELIDFYQMNLVRHGFTPDKILYLASYADFSRKYEKEELERVFQNYIHRFFSNQFKRNCVPDGPKVGSVSLSPRGDWRMPSDANPSAWLKWRNGL